MTIQDIFRVFGAALIGVALTSWYFLGFTAASILMISVLLLYLLVKLLHVPIFLWA